MLDVSRWLMTLVYFEHRLPVMCVLLSTNNQISCYGDITNHWIVGCKNFSYIYGDTNFFATMDSSFVLSIILFVLL